MKKQAQGLSNLPTFTEKEELPALHQAAIRTKPSAPAWLHTPLPQIMVWGLRRAISKDKKAFYPDLRGPTIEGREKENSTNRASLTATPANILPPT